MEYKMFKPEKIHIHETLLFDNNLTNSSVPDCNSYNYNSFLSNGDEIGKDDSNPITYSSSSSYSSSLADCNLHESIHYKQTAINKNRNAIVDSPLSDDDLTNIKKCLVEERKKERSNLKEKLLIRKFQLEEEAKMRVIGESKCKRFVKYDSKIGEGSYKIVYKGFDRTSCQDIAWCEVKREHVDNKEKQQTILKEIEMMLKVDHPNVVKCYNVLKRWWTIHDDAVGSKIEVKGLVIIQELMNEGTLKGMIKKNFHDGICILDINLITKWWYQILDVLRYMHSRIQPPIIHRDVKSENCFLVVQPNDDCVSVKIGDFGLATTINANSKRNTIIGTMGFMAPEVYDEKYDTKVDIYAFGIMMLEVMTNKTPYDDCQNVFQIVSKSMGKYLPDLISNIELPMIREMIMECVHPIPSYRPTAEELCEHPIFQNSTLIVEPFYNDLDKSQTIMKLMDSLQYGNIKPILDIQIRANCDILQDQSAYSQFKSLIFSLDVYQSHKSNCSELMIAVKSYLEDEVRICVKKVNHFDKVLTSIFLQIQYLIKTVIGERWRRIFDGFLDKEHHKSNSPQMPKDGNLIDLNNTVENDESINNFSEYNFNVAMFHKATKYLNLEIETHCRESMIKGLPYFVNMYASNRPIRNTIDEYLLKEKIAQGLSNVSNIQSMNKNELHSATNSNVSRNANTKSIEVSPMKENRNTSDKSMGKESKLSNRNLQSYCSTNSIVETNNNEEQSINFPFEFNNNSQSNLISDIKPIPNDSINIISNVQNSIPEANNIHFRHLSEPQFIYRSNRNCPNNINALYPIGPSLQSGHIPLQSESSLYQNVYQSNNLSIKYNQDPNQYFGYVGNFSPQPLVGLNNNQYYQHQSPQQQKFFNIIQPGFVPSQSNLIISPQPTIPNQGFSGIYSGLYYPQSPLINSNSNIMHNTLQYNNPVDHNSRHQSAEPILTRSLPSIIGNPSVSSENSIAPSIIQTSMASGLSNRIPTISNASQSSDASGSQRQVLVPSNSVQKLNPIFMSSSRPIINRTQAAVSPVPNSKVQEKTKSKRPKTRLKSKYLLRIIEISENISTAEVILVFEAFLPMNTMRFSCSLNNEINSLDLSKFVGDSGQIPGELRKKDILESLISTVKKICHCLLEDINSIPLNEDYVFHPCSTNSSLMKFADCIYQIQISSEIYESAQTSSALASNQYSYLNTIPSQFSPNPFSGSCVSSHPLSRHASNDDLSVITGNSSMSIIDQVGLLTPEIDMNNQGLCDNNSKVLNNTSDVQKKSAKPTVPTENNRNVTITTKCACSQGSKDCCIQIPEFIFPSVKQIIEKLQNPHTKGLIILPQSNEILLRNLRILEIPNDHMFFGLPCSDSSFNVVKGQKDKDFIIAKDTRQSESAGHSKKCVYQSPNEGAVLLDSTGEIQYLRNPSLVIPHAQTKSQIKELPFELTHNKNQSLDCNQIVSVLQSLSTIHSSSDLTKDETFDSPVMLEPINSHSNFNEKVDLSEASIDKSGVSGESVPSVQSQNQSQIQVEYVSLHYVHLPKSAGSKSELESGMEATDRDLPRQQVRSRKISNESLEAASTSRNRMPVYMNEMEHMSQQPAIPKMVVNNPIAIQNVQRPVPVGAMLNQIPLQRMPNVSGAHSGQFLLAPQNPVNQMSPNMLIHNLTGVPQFVTPSPGSTPVPVANTQSNNTIPLAMSNQNAMGLNYTPMNPNQVVIPSGMLPNQIPQMHIQQPQLPNQRMAPPPTMPISSQHISNIQGLPLQNLVNVSQSMMGTAILPGYSNSIHSSIPTATSEQHFISVSHPTEFSNLKEQVRQMPPVNIRQMTAGASPYYDSNMTNSIISDSNLRLRFNQPISSQSQSQSIHFIPYLATTTTQSQVITGVNQSKLVLSDQPVSSPEKLDNVAMNNKVSEADNKNKAEQTIGRFVIRPVTDKS